MPIPVEELVLPHLRITPLEVVLLTEEAWTGPAVKGKLLRSALGFHLRDRECLTGAPTCEGCTEKAECWYAAAFDSPAELFSSTTLTHGDRKLPHPFYMALGETRQRLGRGSEMPVLLSVFGSANPLREKLLAALDDAGASGNWGGRFRIDRVVSSVDRLRRVSGAGVLRDAISSPWPEWELPARRRVSGIAVDFKTPLQLRVKGKVQGTPSPRKLLQDLLRRIHLLAHLYSDVQLPQGWANGLLASSETLHFKTKGRFVQASRFSSGENHRIDLGGWVGRIELRGAALTELLPFLDVGQYIGVGSKTSHGSGLYTLEIFED